VKLSLREAEKTCIDESEQAAAALCLTNTNNILLHVVPRQDMIQANIAKNADTDI